MENSTRKAPCIRRCTLCGKEKVASPNLSESAFGWRKKYGNWRSWCRECCRRKARERARHLEITEKDRQRWRMRYYRLKEAGVLRRKHPEWWKTPAGKLINERNNAIHRIRHATTDQGRESASKALATADAMLAALEKQGLYHPRGAKGASHAR